MKVIQRVPFSLDVASALGSGRLVAAGGSSEDLGQLGQDEPASG